LQQAGRLGYLYSCPNALINPADMFRYFLAACLFCSFTLQAQPLRSGQIDTLAERVLKTFDVPGIAVAVIKDGRVVHAKGYGLRSLGTSMPVNAQTLFGIASNSKAFTAAALGMLVDEGKLSWDDKVRQYIPEFKLYSPFVTEDFSIRDLLTHRSGLGLGAGDLMIFPDSSNFSLEDIIHNLQFLKPVSSFRTKFDYDNNLYIVAGEVVHRVSGLSWDDFVESRILRPLGMMHSACSYDRLPDISNVIDAHAPVNGKVQVIARSTLKVGHAAGGIYSCIEDLSKWVQLWLNGGRYGEGLNKRLFSREVLNEIWTPQTIIPRDDPGYYHIHFSAYGLGFFLADVRGYKQVSHTGGLEGMVTQITMIPELRLGIVVLTNQQEGAAFSAISNTIKDGYLRLKPFDWVAQLDKERKENLDYARHITDSIWKEIDQLQKPAAATTSSVYEGTYRDPWFGDVRISVKDGRYWFASARSPRLTGELFPYKGNSFVVKWRDRSMDADAYVIFSLNEQGRAEGIKMKAISPLTDFSFDFQDLDFHRAN
jgi:CubicO group peptidase (beta-lactamase class C family)